MKEGKEKNQRIIIPKMSREKPYLPGINSPKISVHITVPVETTDKEVRKLVEKK